MTPLSHTSSHLDRALYVWRTISLHAALHPLLVAVLLADAALGGRSWNFYGLFACFPWSPVPLGCRRTSFEGCTKRRVCSRFLMSTANGA